MLLGIKLKAHPTATQKRILSQWMGCSRLIWNAKVGEEKYYSTFARKYYPIGTYAPIDQKTSQFKSKALTPWLFDCPSQIIRNSAVNWYQTFKKFTKGQCSKPKHKRKSDKGSIHLTREVFRFDTCTDGNIRLFIGTKTNNIGYLSFKKHRKFKIPKSIHIRKYRGQYYVSFCYDDENNNQPTNAQHLEHLKGTTNDYLDAHVIGIDRGVAIPAHAGFKAFDFTRLDRGQKKSVSRSQRYIKHQQKRLAKQQKGANRRHKTKRKMAHYHAKCANIRLDFCHKTSRALVNSKYTVFVFEDLKTSNMTRKPKVKQDDNGKYLPNNARAKAGLNKAILGAGWHMIESFTQYKAFKAGKALFKVPAHYTSQECAHCTHIHPDNRSSQSEFKCVRCGHVDNADHNASLVIKKRAITFISHSGTELSDRGVLSLSDIGRGGKSKTGKQKRNPASANETSKKIGGVAKAA